MIIIARYPTTKGTKTKNVITWKPLSMRKSTILSKLGLSETIT